MKKILNYLVAAAVISFGACSNNSTTQEQSTEPGTTASAEEHNDAKFSSDNEKDAQFVVDAVNLNLLNISLSDLAASRASHEEVKGLAKDLNTHHAKANEELVSLAKNKNITVPVAPDSHNTDYVNLNEKNGNDFDKAYYSKLVELHKDAITRFEKAAEECTDADVRNYAASQLTALRSHLDKAMDEQKMAENWK